MKLVESSGTVRRQIIEMYFRDNFSSLRENAYYILKAESLTLKGWWRNLNCMQSRGSLKESEFSSQCGLALW